MKVLLVSPNYSCFEPVKTINIGLGYIASVLERDGHEVSVVDLNVESDEKFKKSVKENEVLGITATTLTIAGSLKLVKKARQYNPDIKIMMGGPHPTCQSHELLEIADIDYVVIGEGEITTSELIKNIENKKNLKNVKGIAFKYGNRIIVTKPRPLIKDLDSLPFPAYHLFPPLEKYTWFVPHPHKRGAGIMTCYDDQTEVLTEDGWKLFKDLTYENEIATLNPENHNLEYQKPSKLMSYDYNGDMCKIECKQINLLVTPNHKLYVRLRSKRPNKFTLIDVSILMNKNDFRMKKDAIWLGDKKDYFILPEVLHEFNPINKIRKSEGKIIPMGLWLEFLGYYLSEGSVQHKKSNNSWIVKISQKVGTESYKKMEDCIKKLGYKYYKHPIEGFFISNKQLCCYLKQFGHAEDKFVPKEIKQLSTNYLKILLDALVLGDGYISKIGEIEYITTSKKLIDDIQEILLKVGWSGNIKNKLNNSIGKIKGKTIKSQFPCYRIIFNKKQNMPVINYIDKHGRRKHTSKENYLGKIYCCEVPNHIIYVRRKGKSVWSGNSRGCPFNCIYCFKGLFGYMWRARSPENVVKEWEWLINDINVEEIAIYDDIFNLSLERVNKIYDLILKKKLNLPHFFPNGLRAEFVNYQTLKKMKKAGCIRVAFGVETGSKRIMKTIDKRLDLNKVKKTFELCKKLDIESTAFFVLGLPGENRETMQETIDFAKELDPTFAQFTTLTPFVGTRVYDLIKREGELLEDWNVKFSGHYDKPKKFKLGELTPELLLEMKRKAYREFYFRPSYLLRNLRPRNLSLENIKRIIHYSS